MKIDDVILKVLNIACYKYTCAKFAADNWFLSCNWGL